MKIQKRDASFLSNLMLRTCTHPFVNPLVCQDVLRPSLLQLQGSSQSHKHRQPSLEEQASLLHDCKSASGHMAVTGVRTSSLAQIRAKSPTSYSPTYSFCSLCRDSNTQKAKVRALASKGLLYLHCKSCKDS